MINLGLLADFGDHLVDGLGVVVEHAVMGCADDGFTDHFGKHYRFTVVNAADGTQCHRRKEHEGDEQNHAGGDRIPCQNGHACSLSLF